MGPDCGLHQDVPNHYQPQEVIMYTVPGEGRMEVYITTITESTPDNFDTEIQVRTECDAIPIVCSLVFWPYELSITATPAGLTLDSVCQNATDTTLTAPTGPEASGSPIYTGNVAKESVGATTGECATSPREEAVFNVTVPTGTFDLVAHTDLEETDGNTVVYIRETCNDVSSEIVCNEFYSAGDSPNKARAVIEQVTTGTYAVFVEQDVNMGSFTPPDGLSYRAQVPLASHLAKRGTL